MFKIKTVDPAEATGLVAAAYANFPPEIGVPQAFRLMSASPALMAARLRMMQFWIEHKTIDPLMQTVLRYLFSRSGGLAGCREANGKLLEMAGLSREQIDALDDGPEQWPLGPKRNALVRFVQTSLADGHPADATELGRLRDLGWSDEEIFEALDYGAMVLGTTTILRILKK